MVIDAGEPEMQFVGTVHRCTCEGYISSVASRPDYVARKLLVSLIPDKNKTLVLQVLNAKIHTNVIKAIFIPAIINL